MDRDTALWVVSVTGAAYSLQTMLVSADSLGSDAAQVSIKRAVGGGMLGLAIISYLAAASDSEELKRASLYGSTAAIAAWNVNKHHSECRAVLRRHVA
jgi:hypothetical protein